MKIDLYAFSMQGTRDFGTVEKQLAALDESRESYSEARKRSTAERQRAGVLIEVRFRYVATYAETHGPCE